MGKAQSHLDYDAWAEEAWDKKLSKEALIEHYYPPSLPIKPVVTQETMELCKKSWLTLVDLQVNDVPGVVYLYTDFYKRLMERSEEFNAVFGTDLKRKGNVMVLAIEFVLSLNPDNPDSVRDRLRGLGESHKFKPIRPWMFSVYIDTLLVSLASMLGAKEEAHTVLDAWSNLMSMVLRYMLPFALDGRIIKVERALGVLSRDIDAEEAKAYTDMVRKQRELQGTGRSRFGTGRLTAGETSRSVKKEGQEPGKGSVTETQPVVASTEEHKADDNLPTVLEAAHN